MTFLEVQPSNKVKLTFVGKVEGKKELEIVECWWINKGFPFGSFAAAFKPSITFISEIWSISCSLKEVSL